MDQQCDLGPCLRAQIPWLHKEWCLCWHLWSRWPCQLPQHVTPSGDCRCEEGLSWRARATSPPGSSLNHRLHPAFGAPHGLKSRILCPWPLLPAPTPLLPGFPAPRKEAGSRTPKPWLRLNFLGVRGEELDLGPPQLFPKASRTQHQNSFCPPPPGAPCLGPLALEIDAVTEPCDRCGSARGSKSSPATAASSSVSSEPAPRWPSPVP
ncbi:uncharacterized protein LOC106028541 [Cavia porcellus]|uniref:uncharacterized protein LOC106028541 n=1 Tax=Cavia porcellus TaxID=10141 RepID=UPI002FDF2B52